MMKRFHKINQYITKIVIMSVSGCILIFCAGRYTSVSPVLVTTDSETPVMMDSNGVDGYAIKNMTSQWNAFLKDASVTISKFSTDSINEEKTYQPSVLKYNLVYLFPENTEDSADTIGNLGSIINNPAEFVDVLLKPLYRKLDLPGRSKVKDSYGGQMYEALNRRDAEWTSSLYKWIQATPSQAAAMKGIATAKVTGRYNPNNTLHKKEEPSSWQIPSWKNVTVHFFDGDGSQIELYSNTQSILSMASVAAFYADWQDTESFKSYIYRLWDASHSFSTQLSEVYYCDGCESLLPSPNEPLQIGTEQAINGIQELQSGISSATQNTAKASSSASQGLNKEDSSTETVTVAAAAALPVTEAPLDTPVPSTMVIDAAEGGSVAPPTAPEQQIQNPAADAASQAVVAPSKPAASNESSVSVANPSVAGNSADSKGAPASSNDGNSSNLASDNASNNTGGLNASVNALSSLADDALSGTPVAAENLSSAEIHLNAEGKFCSGHIDLAINARIIGLSEAKNLYAFDKDSQREWTPYMKSYVNQLNLEDWKEEYGLSPMELGIGKPLTSSEINEYMNMLPIDTSAERRSVIAYALNSVGKIPYYYGGKPRTTGYENNNFSSPTKPDQKGRVLSGLDCSGWVNWVYWSSIGTRLGALGTSGLINEGRGVERSALKAGDIIVRPGIDSHVVMFLSWTGDGSMICIHETGGTTSNVTVSVLNLNWPYYRAILE